MAELTEDSVRNIVREELREELQLFRREMHQAMGAHTSSIRQDIRAIKNVLGKHGMMLQSLQSDVNSLKVSYRTQSGEMHRIGVLLEDLDYRFRTVTELR